MMQTVVSNKAVNRMSTAAVAACMAPLLLRPLLAGECDIDNGLNMGGDGSVQLLQAAAAANNAQAIVITLLDEYENIFGDGPDIHEPYTDSEESESESEEITDDDDGFVDNEDDDLTEDSDYAEEYQDESSASSNEIGGTQFNEQVSESCSSRRDSTQTDDGFEANLDLLSSAPQPSLLQRDSTERTGSVSNLDAVRMQNCSSELVGDDPTELSLVQISSELSHGSTRVRRRTVNRRASGKKKLPTESKEVPCYDEAASQKPNRIETDLTTRISNEATVKSLMQDILEMRKHHLHASHLDLEKEVERLQEQFRKEMDLTIALEARLRNSWSPLSIQSLINEKMKAELEEIALAEANVMYLKKKVYDLELHLQQQREQNSKVELDIGKDEESSSSLIVPLPENQQTNATQNQRAIEDVVRAFTMSSGANKFDTSASRKSGTKGEGTSTNSSLSKLRNRLNFLKERRVLIANELQNLNRGRSVNRSFDNRKQGTGSEHHPHSPENSNKHQEPKVTSSEKGQEPEIRESSSPTNVEGGKKSGRPPFLQKGISESFTLVDKGLSKLAPRTFSR